MTLGTTAIPRWSQNSAPVATGQWCLIPDVPALKWSSSDVPALSPPWLSPCSWAGRAAPILSSFYPSEKAEETLERSIQSNGKPGVGEGATSLFPSASKVWARAQRNGAPEPSGAPPPHPLMISPHPTTTHSTGGTGAPSRRRFATTCPNSHPPTPTSRPP